MAWSKIGNLKGAKGDKGDPGSDGAAATIQIGTVTTGSAGSNASVTNVGTESAAKLNFTIPRGNTGAAGAKGDPGSAGAPGPVGITFGSSAPSGSATAGQGYLNTSTGDLYVYEA